MLLNWSKKRMSGPRLAASGKRFGPYCSRRRATSAASRPDWVSLLRRLTTSSEASACQAVAAPWGWEVAAVFICMTLHDHLVKRPWQSELLRHEAPAFERRPIIVRTLHQTRGEFRLLPRRLLVRDQVEQMADAIEARAPLVVRGDDIPGRELRVCGLEHQVARPRVLEPFAPRAQVRRAQLPLAQRIFDAGLEAALLLLIAHLQPVFDEQDALVDDVQLKLGADLKEATVFLLGAEAHHVLDAGPVVPAAVEDHDLARRREVGDVALHVQLRLLAVGRRRQRHHAEHAGADPLGDGFDRATLPGRVAPFENHDHPQPLLLDPVLQRAQLYLQLAQCLFVFLARHRSSSGRRIGYGSPAG